MRIFSSAKLCCLILLTHVTKIHLTIPTEVSCTMQNRPYYREYSYVGGEYYHDPISNELTMHGQMYVEHLTSPYGIQQPFPLVFIHGKGMTGTNWLNTPDERSGWASFFLGKGYEVYIVDQPARGRSKSIITNETLWKIFSVKMIEERFTATEFYGLWPESIFHSQWPGENSTTRGRQNDPIFDAFYASIVPSLDNEILTQTMVQKAGSALLDQIGPSILVTHSQAGSFGWLIGDSRPNLVKAIIALEPKGPPFREAVFSNRSSRPWGVTDIPLTFDTPTNTSADLLLIESVSINENRTSCLRQQEPVRHLVNLMNMSIVIITAHASYHAQYDHCTVEFFRQAGVQVDFIRLEDIGIKGNGHMLMIEKNNLEIAEIVHQWIIDHVH